MLPPVGPKSVVALVVACVCGWLAASANAFVYWSNFAGSTVGRAGLDGGGANEGFVAAPQASGIAVDGQFVYWADEGAKTIGRANLDGSAPNQNFISGLSDPTGVAVDSGHVYWTDEITNSIGRANLDGSGAVQNFATGANVPQGIAVNSTQIFWANNGNGTIGHTPIGGGAGTNLITGLDGPNGVAVDAGHVYWADFGHGSIGRATLAGGSVDNNFIGGLNSPSAVAVDAGHVYWTTFPDNLIGRANLDGTAPMPTFIAGANGPNGIAVDAGAFPPATTLALLPGAPNGGNGWYTTGVHVTAAAADNVYPVTSLRCVSDPPGPPATFAAIAAACPLAGAGADVSANGVHSAYAAAQDSQGNTSAPVSAGFRIDTTRPTVRCAGAPSFLLGSRGGAVRATVSDAVSGAAAGTVAAAVRASAIGRKSVTLTGADNAGNRASVKCNYAVRARSLSPTPSMTWSFGLVSHGRATTIASMKIASVPTQAALKLVCTGHGCPSKSNSAAAVKPAKCKGKKCRARSRNVDLTRLFRGLRLSAGSRITVTATQHNTNGKAFVFAIRKAKLPKIQIGCLAPGSSKLNRGC
jgi:Low-density lipoprotein receptor repeat class B